MAHVLLRLDAMIRHSARRGITLVEVGAVTAALSVVISGAALVAHARSGPSAQARARQDSERIAAAAREWAHDGDGSGCPTISVLERQHRLSSDVRIDDPWGNRYRVLCDGPTLSVTSPGPDGAPGTPDDVIVPVD